MAILYIELQYHLLNIYGINRMTHLRPLANLALLRISVAEDFTSSLLFINDAWYGVIYSEFCKMSLNVTLYDFLFRCVIPVVLHIQLFV